MLSNSMFLPGDRQILQQKVFILQQELQEYKMKESKLSKLNQSILQSYKLNQTIKENQQNQTKRENRQLITKHREEIRKLKSQFIKDKSQLQTENNTLKHRVKLLEDILEKTKLQSEQNLIDMRITLENNHKKVIADIQTKYSQQMKNLNQQLTQKIQHLEGYVEELEHQNQLYQEYIERKTNQQKENDPQQINVASMEGKMMKKYVQIQNKYERSSSSKGYEANYSKCRYPLYENTNRQYFYDHQNQEQKYQIKTVPKESKKLISELGTKINRAIKEINQNTYYRHN